MPADAWEHEVEFIAVRAQGPGGQNVNKVSNAVHLRFNIPSSSLPSGVKERLLALSDRRTVFGDDDLGRFQCSDNCLLP